MTEQQPSPEQQAQTGEPTPLTDAQEAQLAEQWNQPSPEEMRQGSEERETASSYADSTVAELKDELGDRDLPKSGKKDELISRLEEDDAQQS